MRARRAGVAIAAGAVVALLVLGACASEQVAVGAGGPGAVASTTSSPPPGPEVVTADGDHVLTATEDWQLVITPGGAIELRRGGPSGGTSGVGGFTRPVTLDEATPFPTQRDGVDVTVIAGPVHDDATTVEIRPSDGTVVEAALLRVHGLTWFWVEVPGSVGIDGATARAADGTVLDERTLPPDPPPPAGPGGDDRTVPGYMGDHTNCSFGQDPDGPGVCIDPTSGQQYCVSGPEADPAGVTIPCADAGLDAGSPGGG